jgi:hypothetical protein
LKKQLHCKVTVPILITIWLWEAMDFFKLNEAILLTLNQKDFIKKGGQKIIVTTATEFFNKH